MLTFANNLDPDKAPQNVGPHLRSKLFDIQITYQEQFWMEAVNFLNYIKDFFTWYSKSWKGKLQKL